LPALAQAWYATLTGNALPSAAAARLTACLVADESVEAKHLSLMLPRPGVPMKLDLVIRTNRLVHFLRRIGWASPSSELQTIVSQVVTWDGDINLNLVLCPHLVPPLEVEVFAGPGDVTAAERAPFLDRLVRLGLATPSKAAFLRDAWVNPTVQGADGRLFARSWYVKVRFSGSMACDAKCYLGVTPRALRQPRCSDCDS
jgi:hypothetical protein